MRALAVLPGLALMAAWVGRADDLDQVRAEPNLEKRSKLALESAVRALKAAREDYQAGDTGKASEDARQIEQSVDLAYASLVKTGKNPRKSPRWFKHAEMETRELSRKMEDFQREMSYADRVLFDKAKAKVQEVHDDLLTGLMEGKKK